MPLMIILLPEVCLYALKNSSKDTFPPVSATSKSDMTGDVLTGEGFRLCALRTLPVSMAANWLLAVKSSCSLQSISTVFQLASEKHLRKSSPLLTSSILTPSQTSVPFPLPSGQRWHIMTSPLHFPSASDLLLLIKLPSKTVRARGRLGSCFKASSLATTTTSSSSYSFTSSTFLMNFTPSGTSGQSFFVFPTIPILTNLFSSPSMRVTLPPFRSLQRLRSSATFPTKLLLTG
mmetsp:Transcript_27261/g.51654  ORF Transcript_27261/g.51654 Transcript_27261/m.51654 type:complete len:233 (-) Transcript_27261:1148-1846(-)